MGRRAGWPADEFKTENGETIMRKMAILMLLVLLSGLMAFGGPVKTATATVRNVTMNPSTGEPVDFLFTGVIEQMVLSLSTATEIRVHISDSTTGAVIYTNDALSADVVLFPVVEQTDTAGAGTSTYVSPEVSGLTLLSYGANATNQNLTVTVVYKKP